MKPCCWKHGKPEILSKMVKDVSRYSESWTSRKHITRHTVIRKAFFIYLWFPSIKPQLIELVETPEMSETEGLRNGSCSAIMPPSSAEMSHGEWDLGEGLTYSCLARVGKCCVSLFE
jgi:hypothetical protein